MREFGLSGSLRRGLYRLVNLVSVRVRLVSADLADGGPSVRLLLVGDGWFLRQLGTLFNSAPREIWTKRVGLLRLRSVLDDRAGEFDLGFAVMPRAHQRPFAPVRAYRGKLSVGQSIDLAGGWDRIRSRYSKRLRSLTKDFERKRGFTCRESRSVQDFEYFHQRMYLPYAKSHFGEFAVLKSKAHLRQVFDEGFLLFFEHDGIAVGGAIVTVRERVFWSSTLGVLDGDSEHIRAGVGLATYFFSLRHALQLGLLEMDVGGSFPFLSNGVLQHKAHWGARLHMLDREPQCFDLFLGSRPAAALPFLALHPTVVFEQGRLCVLAAIPQGPEGSRADQLHAALHSWRDLGLESAKVFDEQGVRDFDLRPEVPVQVETPKRQRPRAS